jgi:hypothetical protein
MNIGKLAFPAALILCPLLFIAYVESCVAISGHMILDANNRYGELYGPVTWLRSSCYWFFALIMFIGVAMIFSYVKSSKVQRNRSKELENNN